MSIEFNTTSVPTRPRAKLNRYAPIAEHLLAHIGDDDGAVVFEDEKPGYALGKVRQAVRESTEDVSVRSIIDGNTLTLWAVRRRPRKATSFPKAKAASKKA